MMRGQKAETFAKGVIGMKIESIHARQIFDSRGMPTLEAEVRLKGGVRGIGIAPSGASTGRSEAHERRDGGVEYMGRGVQSAVAAVNGEICARLTGMPADDQARIDRALIALDGTPNRSRLGGNAMIATSLAVADAAAKGRGLPLYRWLGGVQASNLPCPMMNVINGGVHADNNLDIQEFMIVPEGAEDFMHAMKMGVECYHALRNLLKEAGLNTAVGDEGGFAPDLQDDERAAEYLVRAIERAGYRPGEDVSLALDAAAGEWRVPEGYYLPKRRVHMSREDLMARYEDLTRRFPIISIEDPFGDEDFDSFSGITTRLGDQIMIVGDDLFTTNPDRLERGIQQGAANAILIKPNQIGTLTETLEAVALARQSGYGVILSHRSGETESTAIADIAVAVNADFIKSGAPARSERVAKYNRLLKIELELTDEP